MRPMGLRRIHALLSILPLLCAALCAAPARAQETSATAVPAPPAAEPGGLDPRGLETSGDATAEPTAEPPVALAEPEPEDSPAGVAEDGEPTSAAIADAGESPQAASAGPAELTPEHARWLEDVAPLLSPEERSAFESLTADYQRHAFIESFWRSRDPFPETGRNELRERWEARARDARQLYDELDDPRVRVFLANGEPAEKRTWRCGALRRPIEVWSYLGSEVLHHSFTVVFVDQGRRFELWSRSDGLADLLSTSALTASEGQLLRALAADCHDGQQLAGALARSADWRLLEEEGQVFPRTDPEWLQTFLAYSTDVPEGSDRFPAQLHLTFPGARGGRTVVQGVVQVPRNEATAAEGTSFDYLVDGEVLRKGQRFEHFRYRFRLPAAELSASDVPLVFQRHLRPGSYELVLRVQELGSGRFFRAERELQVPFVHFAPGAEVAAGTGPPDGAASADPAAEANLGLADQEVSIRLLPPPTGLQVGNTRLEAVVEGEGIARVAFLLDGQQVMSKTRPPYSVELNLGSAPRNHDVAAVALSAEGDVLARSELLLNAGPHRFAVRLVEPQPGRRYQRSLRAAAEVDVPEGDRLERVEMYLNEELVATLYQAPYHQPILLPPGDEVAYVRAVAYLADGNYVEDLVYVNAPENLEQIEVRLVELYVSALDRAGRPVEDLAPGQLVVREEGEAQQIRRFERVENVPIYAGVMLDTSSSMAEELDEALAAALHFFEGVLTPKDRAALITFATGPELAVRFTNNPQVLAGGLAGIQAAGGTALWDSLIYGLYYFSGVQGKRAIILLSDGDDQGSRFRYEDALEYAQRTGVSIYTVGLGSAARESLIRTKLTKLAAETGGQSFFIDRARELGPVYRSIERELRTQYLVAYQSPADSDDTGFRKVEVEITRPGVQAKTIRGYYP
ncbi:MAG TPA: VWA domain-containing protein [Thermoanaerobaculia bacterium]|nr:VWA domain-containing protein [Thermoanaerobaculia bacterium]